MPLQTSTRNNGWKRRLYVGSDSAGMCLVLPLPAQCVRSSETPHRLTPARPLVHIMCCYRIVFFEAVCPVPTFKPNDQQPSCLTASRMLTFAHSNDSSKSIFFKKALGMKEICFTAKHAGGFTMWPSNFTPYVRAEED